MSGFLRVVTLEWAKAALDKKWKPELGDTILPISGAAGRVSLGEVISKIDVPHFDRAAYDGYAVRASDTFGASEKSPKELGLAGKVMPGNWPRIRVGTGACAEISTGAPMPRGSDAVVMSEQVVTKDGVVIIYRAVSPGENIIKRGSDIKKGQVVVPRSKRLTLADVAALAAVGAKKIRVRSAPRVAIISSGSELLKPNEKPSMGKVHDVNGPALMEAVRACGAEPVFLGIAKDNAPDIRDFVARGLKISDIVLISGGSSVGAGDLAPKAINEMGKPGVIVHGLAMKPGKPAYVAIVHNKPVFGLPGYPVSALMVFDQLVADRLHELSGIPRGRRNVVRARLSTRVISARGRLELVPVRMFKKGGQVLAQPIFKGSGAVTSLSTADGYIEVPLERELLDEGEDVDVKLFEGGYRD